MLITSDESIGEYITLELGLDEYDIYIAGDNPKIVVSVLADKSLLNKKEYELRYK